MSTVETATRGPWQGAALNVFPLVFEPILKPRLWGGARLWEKLGKSSRSGKRIGESWELADLPSDQSVVACGPLAGKTLHEVVELWGVELTGGAALCDGRFPLLIKFLDANEPLSIQVHPREGIAPGGTGVRKKNEAWYVIAASPEAYIYRGVRDGVGLQELREATLHGRLPEMLHRIPVRAGQCYYLPSGTIHALGGGIMVAEVQTPSDTTFRLYDWDRIDSTTGRGRELHIDEALQHALLEQPPYEAERQEHQASVWTTVTRLVRSPSFVVERVRMVAGVENDIPYEEMIVWIVLEGSGSIECEGLADPLGFQTGTTVLLPAGLKRGHVKITSRTMWLEVSVPVGSSLAGYERPNRESPPASGGKEAFVELGVPETKRDQ